MPIPHKYRLFIQSSAVSFLKISAMLLMDNSFCRFSSDRMLVAFIHRLLAKIKSKPLYTILNPTNKSINK
jgi:hypothetical protein